MSARKEEFLRGLEAAGGTPDASPARASVHAMFALDGAGEAELDKQLDALIAEVRRTEEATAAAATATPELTVYRASHDAIVMGHYTTAPAAWAHCMAYAEREFPAPLAAYWSFDEDCVAELMVSVHDGADIATGYVVTPVEVSSEYDAEADE